MRRAAEPYDIFWENMSLNTKERIKNRLMTYSITLLLLGIVVGVTFGLKFLVNFLEKRTKGASNGVLWLVWILALLNSSVITIINFILRFVMRRLTSRERHKTYTEYDGAV